MDPTRAETIDPPEVRPGVPMEAEPRPQDGPETREPPRQAGAEEHLRRVALDEPTPVVGTAQPPRGLSGLLRRRAYGIPERYARHWMLLLLADRVDIVEDRLGATLAPPLEKIGWTDGSRWVRRNPLSAIGAVAGAAWLARRTLGRG